MKSRYTKLLAAGAVVLTLGLVAEATTSQAAEIIITAPGAPPPVRVEPVPPPPPGPPGRMIWVNGHWNWDGRGWVWLAGHYVEVPPHRAHWVEGHWRRGPAGYVWVEGHWR